MLFGVKTQIFDQNTYVKVFQADFDSIETQTIRPRSRLINIFFARSKTDHLNTV